MEEFEELTITLNETNHFHAFIHRVPDKPVFVLHHGGGHTSMSWYLLGKKLIEHQVQVFCFDMRGHGLTVTSDDTKMDIETLTGDFVHLVNKVFQGAKNDIILVGHSLGGSIVVRSLHHSVKLNVPVLGVVPIDVVEGTALEALTFMRSIITKRPFSFKSNQEAIDWCLSERMVSRSESARVSIPPQLVERDGVLVWRTDLRATERYWQGWFEGLSNLFLTCRVAKLLILAGTDRLDKTLTIGQMQGKFQLKLLPKAGHCIQEDEPEKVCEILLEFCKRNERLVLPPKVVIGQKK